MAYATARRFGPAVALTLVVVVFLAHSLPPYLSGGTRVPATFGLHYPLLVAHVLLGSVVMVCALVQLWPGSRRHLVLHRRVGTVYTASAIPAALCAIVIGAATPFGPVLAASNVTLGVLWLWTTVAGFAATRQRRVGAHRRWMLYSVTLALSVITNRIWAPALDSLLEPWRDHVPDGGPQHYVWVIAGLAGWLGWVFPLFLARWWLHRGPPRKWPARRRDDRTSPQKIAFSDL
ncbi:DUF2306 domain-containing protein [Mycolicibacterium mucogenicum]|uniref:DUF2306 domain-containing protein n=1 Tax=Mycolicibacterium mucogenicum TaxID=56689 RepID=UPI00226A2D8F|nr:DUF2306 domain-containing protein [Mycolicibacterium mucogenicum]MCX8561980.1 DUF2306 domain-containing protein [Mycolicibacterium mucogenicum]